MADPKRFGIYGMGLAAVGATSAASMPARGDPLRLRGDAIVETQGSSAPAGLLVLQGSDTLKPWLDVEGLVWTGAKPSWTGDVLVLMVRLREPHGYGEMRAGRFVVSTGAVHPVQIDGVDVVARSPGGSSVEGFAGLPVAPRFGARSYDWIAGARIAQRVASLASFGVSYVQRREDGDISDEELGADLAVAPARWVDLAAFASYDLVNPGFSEARASAAARWEAWRLELFASQLSPGRLLPATSLFSVLGDLPSQTTGATVRWHAAPRLDLLASGAGQDVSGTLGANGWMRASLALDDRGAASTAALDRRTGSLGAEARRVDLPGARWTGVRAISALPLGAGFRTSSEIEIVVPDHPNGRGAAWPWGLASLSWGSRDGWEVAAAVEASSSPLRRYEANALVRLSRSLGDAPAAAPRQRGSSGAR
jgi:hypothetical protein